MFTVVKAMFDTAATGIFDDGNGVTLTPDDNGGVTVTVTDANDATIWQADATELDDSACHGQHPTDGRSFVICRRGAKLVGITYNADGSIAEVDPGAWEADEAGTGGGS